jgi:hypothetical protein
MLKRWWITVLAIMIASPWGCKKEKEGEELEIVTDPVVVMLESTVAEVSWETNLPSNSVVYYGLTEELGDTAVDEEEREQHVVVLSDLVPDTGYYFQVESSSEHFSGTPRSEVGQFQTAMNEASYVVAGWRLFGSEAYTEALTQFEQALVLNSGYAPGYIGRGWCLLRLGSVSGAREDFDAGLAIDATLLEGYVGRSVVLVGLQEYTGAIADGEVVLAADPEYVFAYDGRINHELVRLVLAQAYYATQQYEQAQAQCDVLAPNNGLDPVLPESWVVDGTSYDSYLEALLALIQYLVTQRGGLL